MHCAVPGVGRVAANRGRMRPIDAGKSLPVDDAVSLRI
jgi:hypothetical protein